MRRWAYGSTRAMKPFFHALILVLVACAPAPPAVPPGPADPHGTDAGVPARTEAPRVEPESPEPAATKTWSSSTLVVRIDGSSKGVTTTATQTIDLSDAAGRRTRTAAGACDVTFDLFEEIYRVKPTRVPPREVTAQRLEGVVEVCFDPQAYATAKAAATAQVVREELVFDAP